MPTSPTEGSELGGVPPGTHESTEVEPRSEQSEPKVRLTIQVPGELIDRARNAVFWTPGLTLACLAEEALDAAIRRLEEERGEPFPPRSGRIRTGRPISR